MLLKFYFKEVFSGQQIKWFSNEVLRDNLNLSFVDGADVVGAILSRFATLPASNLLTNLSSQVVVP